MEDRGIDVAKRQRMDSYDGRGPVPGSLPQQHPDSQAAHALHGNHHRGPNALGPPVAYRNQPPQSPYQIQTSAGMVEHHPAGSYPHAQPIADGDPSRNPRSAPPEQTSFSKIGTLSAPRSPKSAHAQRPQLNTSFDGEPGPYPPQSSADLVDPSTGYAPPDSAGHANHYGMRVGSHLFETHPGGPPPHPGMGGHYSEAEMHGGGYPPAYSAPPHSSAPWASHYAPPPLRRHNRATQACDTCRTRKVKCDEGKPRCQYCRDNDQPCVYKEVQPPKADRAQKEIMDGQDFIKGEIHDLRAEVTELKHLLRGLRQAPPQQSTPVSEPAAPVTVGHALERESSSHHPEVKNEVANGEQQAPPGSLEVDHSVGVHRLLRWPTIKKLLSYKRILATLGISHINDLQEDFVLLLEQQKGVLRVHGRGQGPDRYEGTAVGHSNPSTPTNSDDPPVAGSPGASPPEVWGGGFEKPNTKPNGKFSNNTTTDHPGGLDHDGNLRMDPGTMEALLQSYIDNLHNMHPFLSRVRLRRMFERVRLQMNPSLRTSSNFTDPMNRSRKRKLSNGGSPMDGYNSDPLDNKPFLEQRVSTAIVLMVLALGKICLAKKPLCGPVTDLSRDSTTSITSGMSPFSQDSPNIKASPMPMTSPSSSVSGEYRAHIAQVRAQFETAPTEAPRRDDRNVDVIPGLAYYTKGAEILGTLQGGNGLSHVQAMLLASLYCGQLAASIEAWSWLSQAGRACLFLMKDHPFESEKKRDPVRVELIYFAYWTCYQFEGDILAELDLQPSGIEDLHKKREDGIPFPQIHLEEPVNHGHQDRIMRYYSAQIHLRKTLNSIQPFLYPPDVYIKSRKVDLLLHDRYECRIAMQRWREVLLAEMRWDDRDYLTPDILEARLRAKYYGLIYLINRPLLEYALHRMHSDITQEIVEAVRKYRDAPLQKSDEIHPRVNEMEVYYACLDCIEAARRSTTAFDGIIFPDGNMELKNRLIVTNIVGTAHAQFGNMLVLSTAYKSRLGFMIEREEMVRLLDRTVKFLRSHKPVSFTLGKDASILEGILANIDNPLPDTMVSSSSFSSSS